MTCIVHFSTLHPRDDTRIRFKEAASLASVPGYDVTILVQDGIGDEGPADDGVRIIDTGARSGSRFALMTVGAFRMWRAVRAMRPRIAHFHDPELIGVGLALKLSGIIVIYDVHEDLPRQILAKYWIPQWLRRPLASVLELVENLAVRAFDGSVAATPTIAARFRAPRTRIVRNYPMPTEMVRTSVIEYSKRRSDFVYLGGIAETRGAFEMVAAIERLENPKVRLKLAGRITPASLEAKLVTKAGWNRVDYLGWLDRNAAMQLLGEVRAGLVLLRPTPSYLDSLPIKMFEYMAAGLPVIASDFPLWHGIVEDAGCGLLVDQGNPDAVADAMRWVLDNPVEAEEMGRRGRCAVHERLNWESEAMTLKNFYAELLSAGTL